MSDNSTIQWTDTTWNPVTGCTKVSPGCDHCYAETFAERWRGISGHPFEQGFDLKLWPERIRNIAKWKKPRRVFVNSMSDLFHKDVSDKYILDVFNAMMEAPQHTFQVLTKRPERMKRWVARHSLGGDIPRHIWLGTSIESTDYGWRASDLRATLARTRFLSLEPLLGPIAKVILEGMNWVIVGGESGPGHRPMPLEWARKIRDDCKDLGIPFFFKQVGAFRPTEDAIPSDLRIREYPA